MVTLKVECLAGSQFNSNLSEAYRLSVLLKCYIQFKHHHVLITVEPNGDYTVGW